MKKYLLLAGMCLLLPAQSFARSIECTTSEQYFEGKLTKKDWTPPPKDPSDGEGTYLLQFSSDDAQKPVPVMWGYDNKSELDLKKPELIIGQTYAFCAKGPRNGWYVVEKFEVAHSIKILGF